VRPKEPGPWLRATITNIDPITVAGTILDRVEIKLEPLLKSDNELFPSSPNTPSVVNNVAVAFNFTDPIPVNIGGTCTGTGCRQGTPQFSAAANGTDFPAGSPFTGFDLALFLGIPPNSFNGSDIATFRLSARESLDNTGWESA
jgi:hypothetical protein